MLMECGQFCCDTPSFSLLPLIGRLSSARRASFVCIACLLPMEEPEMWLQSPSQLFCPHTLV